MRGPWGKETEYGDYEYYIPSGKYLVMNASNPKQYDYVATACNVYVGNPENDDEYATYSFHNMVKFKKSLFQMDTM